MKRGDLEGGKAKGRKEGKDDSSYQKPFYSDQQNVLK